MDVQKAFSGQSGANANVLSRLIFVESTDDEADTTSAEDQNEVKSEVKSDAENSEEASSVSGMSEYLNGNLALIEDTMQQLSSQAKRDDSVDEEDTALDIRPDVSMQAHNKIVCLYVID